MGTYLCLGFTHAKTPCAATLHNLFKRLDIATLESVLSQWVVQTLQLHPVGSSQLAVAIDGKMLNGSAKQQATVSHLLSVVSHQLGVTIAQQPVDKKTNEIPISTEILSAFDVKGMIVTTDALLTQRKMLIAALRCLYHAQYHNHHIASFYPGDLTLH